MNNKSCGHFIWKCKLPEGGAITFVVFALFLPIIEVVIQLLMVTIFCAYVLHAWLHVSIIFHPWEASCQVPSYYAVNGSYLLTLRVCVIGCDLWLNSPQLCVSTKHWQLGVSLVMKSCLKPTVDVDL